jgi:hypothetical protein
MITNTHSFNFKTEAREGQNEKILPQALVARNTAIPSPLLNLASITQSGNTAAHTLLVNIN